MENIPFRSSGSSNRSDDAPAKEPEPKPTAPAAVERPHPRPSSHRNTTKSSLNQKKLFVIGGVVAVVVIIIVVVALCLPRNSSQTLATIDSSKYQAVTLTNGDIYFGKLQVLSDQYMKMSDIYYLKPQTDSTAENKDAQGAVSQNFNLTKFTDVAFSPEDVMTIPKTQILHFENMQPDGKVAGLINQYKKAKN